MPLPPDVRAALVGQDGLVTRSQVLDLGHGAHDLRRWQRQRLLTPVHPGVYVDHTGPLTWHQRACAGVLYAGAAALHGCCALRAAHGPGWRGHDDDGPIHVAVEAGRRVVGRPGLDVHRVRDLAPRVLWQRWPARARTEEAVLDAVLAATDDLAAVQVISAAVGSRSTTAGRLERSLARRARVPRRAFLEAVLRDVASGACSVLEVAYLRDVERAHGLPRGRRQVPRTDRPGLRDVLYPDQHTVVELDGRLDHLRVVDREADLERDLAALDDGLVTARVGWGQAVGRPCRTALAMGRLLRTRGWDGDTTRCPRCA